MDASLASTGIGNLDDVLGGGLPRNRLFLVQGDPGAGKTTLGLQFLLAGAANGETGLYVTLSETEDEIKSVAASHGWSLEGISLFELSAFDQSASLEQDTTLFDFAETDLQGTTKTLLARVEQVKPSRVVFDSLSEVRLLAQSSLRYRRQLLALKQYFAGKQSTVILLDDRTSEAGDPQLQSLANGVLAMEQIPPLYGEDRRRLRVVKLRGRKFRGGYHDFVIRTGGLQVFPRLVAAEHRTEVSGGSICSGLPALDALLGGGLDSGTSTLILGPAGSGKSSLALHYAMACAREGGHPAIFAFEEGLGTLFARGKALGMDIGAEVKAGRATVQRIDPAEMGPGEFSWNVRKAVEEKNARVVVVDSLNGYLQSMPEHGLLTMQMHELLTYLSEKGVVTILVMAQHGMIGSMQTTVDVSYLSDTVILLRFFEAGGRVRKAISVLKKRSGHHEDTIREMSLAPGGLRVGEVLKEFSGVLTGVPRYAGAGGGLIER
jgi:circadian clock protein KaiC